MRDIITRSDKAPYEEIAPLSGWELVPLNPGSGQPVRHFASISELIAYAYGESPARKQLIQQLATRFNLVLLGAADLGDYTRSVVFATIQVLAEQGVISAELAKRISDNMTDLLAEPFDLKVVDEDTDLIGERIAEDLYPNCTGDPLNCPDCGGSEPGEDEWPNTVDRDHDAPHMFLGFDLS